MKIIIQSLLLSTVLFLLSGCAQPTPPELVKNLDYGPYPENYVEIVDYYLNNLKGMDLADAVAYTIVSEPRQYVSEFMEYSETMPKYGWAVVASLTVDPSLNLSNMLKEARSILHGNTEPSIAQPMEQAEYLFYIRNGEVVGYELISQPKYREGLGDRFRRIGQGFARIKRGFTKMKQDFSGQPVTP